MNPIPPAPTPAPKRITPTDQPVFPCWLWHPYYQWCWVKFAGFSHRCTHWLPDQPTAPTCTPTEGEQPVLGNSDDSSITPADAKRPPTEYPKWMDVLATNIAFAYHCADKGVGKRPEPEELKLWISQCAPVSAKSPGSGEALREAIEEAVMKIHGYKNRGDLRYYGNVHDEANVDKSITGILAAVTPFLAQPATPPLPSGEGLREADTTSLLTSAERLHLAISVMIKDWKAGDFVLPRLAEIHMEAVREKYLEVGMALAFGEASFQRLQKTIALAVEHNRPKRDEKL